MLILLLVVLHAPTQAQALLFFDFFPVDLLPFATNEPAMLALTGLALLGLARLGVPRRGIGAQPDTATPPAPSAEDSATVDPAHHAKRAA